MDRVLLEHLFALFDRSTLAEMTFAAGGTKLHLVRDQLPQNPAKPAIEAETPSPPPVSVVPRSEVTAPCFGTFFRRPNPDSPPFVEVGDTVAEGQTLAVVEAMKMLNAIECDRAGRIVAIREQDGASVAAGAVLFEIEATEAIDV
ncbi:acetyl-CoA carboxylase biotin carboxyl carrier protein subunit [Bosea vestrisii]|uniref:acetyl-CoA carboxylase biotin carboxyl carrier protein n=1 Tax=Bosea vestrisii TaxID=151416 RepID=UPI0024DF5EBA|nr:acetyl-CoA carboxylase biotin carboxyl carrier protein subunit [Bosea vestrisii]WID95217.1 acetyl-CoA carboxylase biotin carboxyl carrier protein subunit [Bosea vestrisii]